MNLEDKIKNLPTQSGVYLFRDDLGRVIYVGKATSLRERVRQYFQASSDVSPRLLWLRQSIRDLDYILVNSPVEALVLEANLIKRHRPFFNIRMKDDKRYPAIEITVYEDYPRMRIVRKTENKKSRYFGPYTSSLSMRRVFKLIQKAFRVRTCKYDLDKSLDRPCLDYHIGLCPAPCARYVTVDEYRAAVQKACRFLDGRAEEIVRSLVGEIDKCSENLEFEKCIHLRELLESVKHVTASQPMVTTPGDDSDFIGLARDGALAAVIVFQVRDGKVLGRHQHALEIPLDDPDGAIIQRFIQQYYKPGFFIPQEIFSSALPENTDEIESWLSSVTGRKVSIHQPQRGDRKKMTELASANAREYLDVRQKSDGEPYEKNGKIGKDEKTRAGLEDLKEMLSLSEIPRRIEGFDVSNISGTLAVASMVVFLDGEPHKSHYRRFKIRGVEGADDYAMIKEAVSRRLANLKLGELESFRDRPNLILIDGGKGQLSAALEAVKETGLDGLSVISLAKREEEVFAPGLHEPLPVEPDSPGLRILQMVRDEAHLFAVSYHRKLRSQKIEVSILDSIQGISKKRKETLLSKFDSIDDIREASLYDLQELPGFNRKVAENVLKFLGTGQ
jgi:excinuclease ABC subunit C